MVVAGIANEWEADPNAVAYGRKYRNDVEERREADTEAEAVAHGYKY